MSAEELPQPTLHLRVPTPADTGGLVPHPAGVQAGLAAQDVAALAAAEVSTVGLVRPAVARGQLAGAAALHVLLHLQGGALLVAGPGGDTALGHDYCHRPGPETKEM